MRQGLKAFCLTKKEWKSKEYLERGRKGWAEANLKGDFLEVTGKICLEAN